MTAPRPSAIGVPGKFRGRTKDPHRTCARDGCDTILSRYNHTDLCGVHEPARTLPATRQSG